MNGAASTGLDTRLRLFLQGDNPQRSFGDITYFQRDMRSAHARGKLGRNIVDRFLRTYFGRYGFQWMDSETFLSLPVRETLTRSPSCVLRNGFLARTAAECSVLPSILLKDIDAPSDPAFSNSQPCVPCRRENKGLAPLR